VTTGVRCGIYIYIYICVCVCVCDEKFRKGKEASIRKMVFSGPHT
jgi:hypothetical protein